MKNVIVIFLSIVLIISSNSMEMVSKRAIALQNEHYALQRAVILAEAEGLCKQIHDNCERAALQERLDEINAGIKYTGGPIVPQAVDSHTAMLVNRYIDSMRNIITTPIDLATIVDMDDPNQLRLVRYFLNEDAKAQAAGVRNPLYVYKGWQRKIN